MKIITHDESGLEILQGTPAWKRLRMGKLTGTSVEDVLPGAKGGYKPARQLALHRIVSEILTDQPAPGMRATATMRAGIEREPDARMYYQERTGDLIDEVAFIQHDWMRVGSSPDGLVLGAKRGVEIKSPLPSTHLGYLLAGGCPDEYRVQVQLNLWITGYDVWKFVSYCPEFKDEELQLFIYDCKPDLALHAVFEKEVANAHAEVNLLLKKISALTSA